MAGKKFFGATSAYIQLKNKNEIAIIQRYSYFAKCYIIALSGKYL
jgi:hypothetical protein